MSKLLPNTLPYQVPASNNMGIVRYLLSLTIVINHFVFLSGAEFVWPIKFAVGGFFSISGFLMIGSFMRRNSVKKFMKARLWRLFPSYWATVLIFALLLGIVSTETGYFFSATFWKYLCANILCLNFLQPCLPGVFEGSVTQTVNASLWTMKVEIMLYLSIPVFVWLMRFFRKRPWILIAIVYAASMAYRTYFYHLFLTTGDNHYMLVSKQFIGQLMYFYSGALVYIYYDTFLRYRKWILPLVVALLVAGNWIPYFQTTLQPVCVAFLVLWLSFVGTWGAWENKYDNVSYNIYLVHFPVIQLFLFLGLDSTIGLFGSFIVVYLVSWLLALVINRFIEKPLQKFYRKPRLTVA